MAGLGLLIYGLLRGAVGIAEAVDNSKTKKETFRYTENGEPTWIDRYGHRYINGEKLIGEYDYKNNQAIYKGEITGKVYIDPKKIREDKRNAENEEKKKKAIANGWLAYMKYDPVRKMELTCEIATDKYIAYLEGDENGNYKKYYLPPSQYASSAHMKPKDDEGIPITREEFDKLNISMGTHSARDDSRSPVFYYRHVGILSW